MRLILGDCLDKLKDLPDNSVDSIVTDPPYGLSFMGKKWDYDVPSTEIWSECLRVLKPGGHLLSFAGSRTYHRMAVRIEDAGFEIRDQIMWVYGSGFPKSHNIGKAVDKLQGNDREVVGKVTTPFKMDNHTQTKYGTFIPELDDNGYKVDTITKGTSEWEGWGTALKPAHEPIVMARKPFKGNVAQNVLEWGTGGINIDESRIGTYGGTKRSHQGNEWPLNENGTQNRNEIAFGKTGHDVVELNEGRWPANIIFDEEAGEILDQQSGISKSPSKVKSGGKTFHGQDYDIRGEDKEGYNDKGGASRFFYCPKASKKDRNDGLDEFEKKQVFQKNTSTFITDPRHPDGGYEHNPISQSNHHPTVKPTELMLYLIKLVTPKGGTVMDCFMGSGSTGKAAVKGGFDFIGIEREEEYYKIAEARINNMLDK
jgi:site-specific DNA-methyltransferase (adenine-specific)